MLLLCCLLKPFCHSNFHKYVARQHTSVVTCVAAVTISPSVWTKVNVQTLLNLSNLKSCTFKTYTLKEVKKNWDNNIFQTCIILFVVEVKAQWNKKYSWAKSQEAVSHVALIRFHWYGVWISSRLPCTYKHIWPHVCSILTCTKSDLHQTFYNIIIT